MPSLRLVLGDQLNAEISSLSDINLGDAILMAEVMDEATYVKHHKQKIAFVFSAMRHFALELKAAGHQVFYTRLDDKDNTGSLYKEVIKYMSDFDGLIVTECGEYRLAQEMKQWDIKLGKPVSIRKDSRFISTTKEFATWATGRKQLRMEYFYRDMRRQTSLLMQGADPIGGQWNYDQENRKALPKDYKRIERYVPHVDEMTRDVIALVQERFTDHFGSLDRFIYGVTRDQALQALDHFIEDALPTFGMYQDAMGEKEDFLSHSLLSAYLNSGLLLPLEVCQAAEDAYKDGCAPLNAVEGFIRQIIGWREYVRGLYWLKMPQYKQINALNANVPLPDFYWTGETDMVCMSEAIRNTKEHAYAHHIQRLMVIGNFALLAGIAPDAINEWYLIVYADAYEWVELPNTHGMAIYADGGMIASKPYAASGAYINRMSNYCKSCEYKVKQKTGEEACPFNYLYWDFMIRNEKKLRANPRMGMVFRNLDRKSDVEKNDITTSSEVFLRNLA